MPAVEFVLVVALSAMLAACVTGGLPRGVAAKFEEFQGKSSHKAFAYASSVEGGWSVGESSNQLSARRAMTNAVAQCDRGRREYAIGPECLLHAVDDDVVAGMPAAKVAGMFGAEGSDAPSSRPIIRLETGMHTAVIRRIGTDAAGRLLATASEDKTVRLWSLPDGRALRVLRVPAGAGNEGKIYATAVSPDATLVAAGGLTGFEWEAQGFVYLFDARTGHVVQRLGGMHNAIQHLVFSADGAYLAATLWGNNGVRVWRTHDWLPVLKDSAYDGSSYAADFDGDGRLVTTSHDGFIRLYDRNFKPIARVRAPGGKQPDGAAFSPDGRRVAVGYVDTTRVDVLSGADLTFLFAPDTKGVFKGNLGTVAWSADGRFLYAGGLWISGDTALVRRWADGGRGAHMDLAAAQNSIMDLHALPGGGMAYASHDPVLGTLDDGGGAFSRHTSPIADFRENDTGFLVSPDGSEVQFGFEAWGRRPARFSLGARTLVLDPPEHGRLHAPVSRVDGLSVTGWRNTREPKVDGRPLALEREEYARSLAIARGGDSLLLGADWNLRLFARDGTPRWRVPLPGVAWAVNLSADGRMAVATLGDGTIRWFRTTDGGEVLALFAHRDGTEWVAWTPDGYYLSSPGGDDLIGWHVNKGSAAAADFYAARQFERILHRPEYVTAYFRSLGDRAKAVAATGDDFFDIGDLASIAPPKIDITAPVRGTTLSGDRVTLRFAATKRSLPMRDFAVFVDGIPVTPSADRILGGAESAAFERQIEIPLFEKDSDIRVEVFNGTSLGIAETFVKRTGTTETPAKGDLYLLTVGVSRFPGVPGADLDYAALDAEAFADFFEAGGNGLFGRVLVEAVSDNSPLKPTRETILGALEFVKQAGARDTVIVFLASHGLSDRRGTYYFVPRDAAGGDVKTVLASAKGGRALAENGTEAPSLISWETFFEVIRSTAGRRLFVVDTCQARNVAGNLDVHSLAKRSASASFALMAASAGDEESQEYPAGRHGVFTYALLQGLSGKGDGDGDGRVTLNELFRFAVGFVKANRALPDLPQTPQLTAPGRLGDMVLARYR